MNDNFDDQLSRRLASLNADLAGTKLPGANAARQRAAQRTRHQLTGGLVTGVAVVAIGAIGIIRPDFRADPPPPADTPTVNPTTDQVAIPEDALMTNEDVTNGTNIDWEVSDGKGTSFACVPAAPASSTQVHFVNGNAGRFDHFIEAPPNPSERFTELKAEIESCVDNLSQQDDEYGLDQAWSVSGIGDEAWMAAYWAPLLGPDEFATAAIVEVRLVRSENYITVVADGGPAQDFNGSMSAERAVQATTRLCEAVDTPCPGALDFQHLYPEVIGALPGWLSVSDIADATGLAEITEGGEVMPTDGWGYVGMPLDPSAAGARSVETRMYSDPRNLDAPILTQIVARFDDDAAARDHYTELVAAANSFTQDGDSIENTGTISGADYDATTWRSTNSNSSVIFIYGVVVRGNAVSSVVHLVSNDKDQEVSDEQLAQLMGVAGERLGES